MADQKFGVITGKLIIVQKRKRNSRLKVEVMFGSLFETEDEGDSARDTEKNLRSILCTLQCEDREIKHEFAAWKIEELLLI